MSGPANAIMGEEYGTDLPLTELPETDLSAEKNAAKFSKTAEFKQLKDHFQQRIAFYQTYLPSGKPIADTEIDTMSALNWKLANLIISEFNAVIAAYEQAEEVVRDAARRKTL